MSEYHGRNKAENIATIKVITPWITTITLEEDHEGTSITI